MLVTWLHGACLNRGRFNNRVKTRSVIAVEFSSIAVILFAMSLILYLENRDRLASAIVHCPSCLYELESSLSLFGLAYAIAGIGLLVTQRFERSEVENRNYGV